MNCQRNPLPETGEWFQNILLYPDYHTGPWHFSRCGTASCGERVSFFINRLCTKPFGNESNICPECLLRYKELLKEKPNKEPNNEKREVSDESC